MWEKEIAVRKQQAVRIVRCFVSERCSLPVPIDERSDATSPHEQTAPTVIFPSDTLRASIANPAPAFPGDSAVQACISPVKNGAEPSWQTTRNFQRRRAISSITLVNSYGFKRHIAKPSRLWGCDGAGPARHLFFWSSAENGWHAAMIGLALCQPEQGAYGARCPCPLAWP